MSVSLRARAHGSLSLSLFLCMHVCVHFSTARSTDERGVSDGLNLNTDSRRTHTLSPVDKRYLHFDGPRRVHLTFRMHFSRVRVRERIYAQERKTVQRGWLAREPLDNSSSQPLFIYSRGYKRVFCVYSCRPYDPFEYQRRVFRCSYIETSGYFSDRPCSRTFDITYSLSLYSPFLYFFCSYHFKH